MADQPTTYGRPRQCGEEHTHAEHQFIDGLGANRQCPGYLGRAGVAQPTDTHLDPTTGRWVPTTPARQMPDAEPGCPTCRTILNAKTAGCDDPWHADNPATAADQTGRQRGDRPLIRGRFPIPDADIGRATVDLAEAMDAQDARDRQRAIQAAAAVLAQHTTIPNSTQREWLGRLLVDAVHAAGRDRQGEAAVANVGDVITHGTIPTNVVAIKDDVGYLWEHRPTGWWGPRAQSLPGHLLIGKFAPLTVTKVRETEVPMTAPDPGSPEHLRRMLAACRADLNRAVQGRDEALKRADYLKVVGPGGTARAVVRVEIGWHDVTDMLAGDPTRILTRPPAETGQDGAGVGGGCTGAETGGSEP